MAGRSLGTFGPIRAPIYPPTGAGVFAAAEAPEEPVLAHVHGFHAAARPPAVFLGERRAAFAAGRLVVVLEVDGGEQQFIYGHTDAITCLAYSADQALGASGQVRRAGSRFAEVLLWSPESLQPCATIAFHQADVEAVGFCQGGEVLVTIGADRDRTMALWASASQEGRFHFRRNSKTPLAVCSAYKGGAVHGVLAAPGGPDLPRKFATFGAAHVKFWQCDRLAPMTPEGRRGAFIDGAPREVVAVAWAARDRLVAGGSDGEVYFFVGTRAIRRFQLQRFSVAMLLPVRDALLVVYAHGVCSLLHGERALDIDVASLEGAPDPKMQSQIVGGAAWRQNSILLASRTHLMFLDLVGGLQQVQSCTVLVQQPSKELTAVCAHPTEPRLFTGALDGGVRCYRSDVHRHLRERSFKASAAVTCLAVSGCAPGETSAWLAVGCDDSTLSVLSEGSFHYVLRRCLSATRARLTCARFSPCDASGTHPLWLAVGTDDGCIHTFRFKDSSCTSGIHTGAETVTKAATLRGHAAPVFDLAFADALPCGFLLSVDTSGQVLAFDVPMARRLQSAALVRDVPFAPWTSPIGWQVQGCWAPQRAGAQGESATLPPRRFCEVAGRGVIAVSDASAPAVELFPFPCPSAPRFPPPRLEGPARPVAALLHSGRSDCLLAASDTVLFSWAWPTAPAGATPLPLGASTPLRQVQGVVCFDTPEGRKRAVAVADGEAQLLTPQRPSPAAARLAPARGGGDAALPRGPAKENAGAVGVGKAPPRTPPPPVSRRPQAQSTPPSKRQVPPPPPPARAWEEDEEEAEDASPYREEAAPPVVVEVPVAPLEEQPPIPSPDGPLPEVAPLPGGPGALDWAIQTPSIPAGIAAAAHEGRRLRRNNDLAPKIGAPECGDLGQVSCSTMRIREDTEARARSIHQRQQFDTVGLLLGGGGPGQQSTVSVEAVVGAHREAAAGRFLYRLRDRGDLYEVEARLPQGLLLRVLRNPLRRTLTFEGEVACSRAPPSGGAAGAGASVAKERLEERLVVRVPAGFDLAGPPSCVERHFDEGRCFVALARRGGVSVAARPDGDPAHAGTGSQEREL